MEHLSECHPQNRAIITMTAVCKLDTDGYVLTPTQIRAATEALHNPPMVRVGTAKRNFKNCTMMWLQVTTHEGQSRNVSVKVFTNSRVTLHVTGTRSREMLADIVDRVCTMLRHSLRGDRGPVPLSPLQTRIVMVNYRLHLPGRICLAALVRELSSMRVLTIFDPSSYAAVRIKLHITDPTRPKMFASIMVFDSGKVVAIIPDVHDRDQALHTIKDFIQTVIDRWDVLGFQ
jgi:hypothetical protein